MCGAIFDVSRSRETIASLESKVSRPDFWQDQEQAQKILQQRKAAEGVIGSDEKLARMSSDIETYFHLAEEETNVAQRDALLQDIEREIAAADTYVSELETLTLLAGENDRLNAIMTIKSGAGGLESQDWAEMLMRMYLRW
ncbi:MAG TPA: PCRF domain-containing protein, partial [Candidatus Acidoferrales bacterium]|nr:PCRF domain-containing protein [Candidatus Acidoferrales bacterium]